MCIHIYECVCMINPKSHDFLRIENYKGLQSHMNLNYSIIFYGKELTFHEAIDPLVCFNQHAFLLGLTQGSHFVYHMIFIYI